MGRSILAGDHAGEAGQHSGQSWSGDRYDGCRGVGRGGCDRHPARLRWLPRCPCPGGPANWLLRNTCPGRPDKRRDLPEESCGRPGHGDCPHIRRCQAVYGLHSALSVRVVPGPTLTHTLTIAVAFTIALAFTLTQALEIALAEAVALALAFALVIPVADGLRPMGLRWAAR